MPDLERAAANLKRLLGDYLGEGRADGVFHIQPGGPGSVPTLTDLDVPELHLDLLPEVPTPAQVEEIAGLGYAPESTSRWLHPGGWRLVLCDHGSGWRARQQALRALLLGDPEAGSAYRRSYDQDGRAAADAVLEHRALEHYTQAVGWEPPRFVAGALAGLAAPWMVAGGLALDLYLGRVTRPHDDIDVVVPRDAQAQLPGVLRGWRLDAAVDGAYQPFVPPLELPSHQVHARHPGLPDVLFLDLMLTDMSGGAWHYRRDPVITLPLERARRVGAQGMPYLAPEAVLLFKAASNDAGPRGKDAADFERALPSLDAQARTWLRGALAHTRPGHAWLERL